MGTLMSFIPLACTVFCCAALLTAETACPPDVDTRKCDEKEDMVQLALKAYKSGASTNTPQPAAQQG
jgi:hypothetical protein